MSWMEYHQPQDVHATISYEDIATFLRAQRKPRLDWRASVFQQAAHHHRTARRNSGNNPIRKGRKRADLHSAAIAEAIELMKSHNPPSGRRGEFSIKDVARGIGTSPATVHNLFRSFGGLLANVQVRVYQDMIRTILNMTASPEKHSPERVLAETFYASAEMIYLSSRDAGLQNIDKTLIARVHVDLRGAVCACVRTSFPQAGDKVGNHIAFALLGASRLAANDVHGLGTDWRADMQKMVLHAIRAGDEK